MNTGELNEKTGDNNEDKNSEDIKNQNVIKDIETELSNKELEQIIDNIGSQSPADDMPNEKEDDNDNPADNHSEVLDTNKIIPTNTPPPNDGSESHDEDLILRWDDDDETTNHEKIDENIHHDLESFGNSYSSDKTEACAPIEDEDKANKVENITEDIAEDDSIDFLKQQLKVLSESINPNLNTHAIDVPNLLGSEFGAPSTSKSKVDAPDDFGETVACKESASLDTEIGSNSRQDVDANEMVVNEKIEADCSQDENIKLDIQDDSNINKTNDVVGDVETENVFKDVEQSISDEENSLKLNDAVDDFIKDVKPGTSNVALENDEAINTEKTEIETEGSINSVNIEKSVEEIEENRSEITTVAVTENITEDTINKPLDVEVTDNVADGTPLDDNLTKKEGDTNDTESMQLDPKIKEDSPEAIENIENIREESIKETNAINTPDDTSIINDNSTDTKIEDDIKELKSVEGDTQKIVEIVDASEIGTDITNIDTEVTTEETKTNPGIEEMEVDITEAIDAEPSDAKFDQCESYIDLSSQSPISLDETSDTEKPIDTQIDDKESKNENKPSNEDPNYYNVKSDHRLRPDVMIEIPSQSLLDVDMEESIDIDSEDASQEAENKTEETKDNEEIVENNVAEKKEDSKQLVETNRLPLNEEDKLDSDIIDVDLDDDSNEEVASDDKIDNTLNDNSNVNEETNKDSVMEANKITEQKDISNNEEHTKEAKSDENADDIIDLDDYEVSEVNNFVESDDSNRKNEESNKEVKDEVEPSMSSECVRRLTPDASDEVAEVSDSLGLLAESSRVRRDEGDEEFDEDDDYDQDDESSNQMTADHSEDSNAQHSESDSKGQGEKSPEEEARAFNFTPAEVGESPKAVVEEQVKKPADSSSKSAVEESSSTEKNLEEIGPNEQDLVKSPGIETVKLDNSDDEAEQEKDKDENTQATTPEKTAPSPSKTKKLEIANPRHILNIVDLEESSSEEDVQEVAKPPPQDEQVEETEDKERETPSDVTSVNIPTEIEIMSTSCGNTSEIVTKEGEVVITGVPKPPPHKPARLNTSEVTIKTAPASMESTLIIPETKMQTKPKMGLEIFSLDSDDEDIGTRGKGGGGARLSALELDAALRSGRCLRRGCGAGARGAGALAHYCDQCAATHYRRTQELVEGIKNMTPLLDLNMEKLSQDLVEISDSDSETESKETKDTIGQAGAEMLHENLADIMNGIWKKYKMDTSLDDAKVFLNIEVEKLESESKEINKMLNDCQTATDKLRRELYATFEPQRLELPPVNIVDNSEFTILLTEIRAETNMLELKPGKRRLSATNPNPAKRPAIPMGYTPLDPETVKTEYTTMLRSGGVFVKAEEDKEISVVQLSAEAAPPDLPGAGEARRAALRPGMVVYAMRNAFGAWTKARILDQVKIVGPPTQFPSFRVRFENKVKNPCKVLSARCLAYQEPPDVRLTIGTRVIALFKESANVNKRESYYSGIVAEIPNPVNNYRYLVFFDDGYAQYAAHAHTRVVCACAAPVWEEVHPFSREFVRNYLCAYPERPMVRLHAGQKLNTEWNGKWWDSTVIQVDASLVQVHFEEDNRTEWIYRGSTRLEPLFLELQAAVKPRSRHVPRTKAQMSVNMPYVEYTRSYEQDKSTIEAQQEELRRQRAVAKKSTTVSTPGVQEPPEPYTSRVVYYTPRNAVRPYKMVPHTCGPKCKRSDVLTLKELKSYNPLAKPLLSGWERQLVRHKGSAAVLYRAPCGRRVRSAAELHRYLRATRADMPVDLFDFNPDTHCLAEFVLSKCVVGKKDLSHGKENVPVPCVNNVDDSLPEFCSYNTERTPTAGVPLNLDPEFLCGCDCTDDCADKTKCACWKLTLEGAKTIGLEGPNVGYDFKRLPEPLPSGIYECNVRCKCRHTCLNRVAQHPLQLKLQVFKTPNRGWGIRALNDVPKGAFLCVYAGNLLTDATANLDGLNEGDEYLAELDYIEVVEQMKEGYEDDVPEADKELDKKESVKKEEKSEEEESSSEEDEEAVSKNEEEDDDFLPGYIGPGVMTFNKRLRKRGKVKEENKEGKAEIKEVKAEMKEEPDKEKDGNGDEECITISDDEEVREPSRFAAQAEMGVNEHVPKYRSVRSHFGKDEACYIMDAKVQGNIGRYLNHSCSPNVFVQNVFVDTHDPRFPWVAFFALAHIRAGTELTWNYNYDVGSVPGKVLYCYCGAPNCRRRLL